MTCWPGRFVALLFCWWVCISMLGRGCAAGGGWRVWLLDWVSRCPWMSSPSHCSWSQLLSASDNAWNHVFFIYTARCNHNSCNHNKYYSNFFFFCNVKIWCRRHTFNVGYHKFLMNCLTPFVTFRACVRADDMNTELLIATIANRWWSNVVAIWAQQLKFFQKAISVAFGNSVDCNSSQNKC